jgi:hypothetical protein
MINQWRTGARTPVQTGEPASCRAPCRYRRTGRERDVRRARPAASCAGERSCHQPRGGAGRPAHTSGRGWDGKRSTGPHGHGGAFPLEPEAERASHHGAPPLLILTGRHVRTWTAVARGAGGEAGRGCAGWKETVGVIAVRCKGARARCFASCLGMSLSVTYSRAGSLPFGRAERGRWWGDAVTGFAKLPHTRSVSKYKMF